VTVIPNAVDARAFRFGDAPDPSLLAKLGLAGATVIGFAGSFYAYEGLDLLLDAAPLLLPRHPELRLLLVGGGPQEQALKAQANALGLGERVVFTGRVPHADVQRYYDLIDVMVYPRHRMRLTDLVTPLKPLEAMAQGRMFVASDVGGHRELVRDGETGFLFPAGDVNALAREIDQVLARRADWPRLRGQARRFVESRADLDAQCCALRGCVFGAPRGHRARTAAACAWRVVDHERHRRRRSAGSKGDRALPLLFSSNGISHNLA
jgi:glycosyltransferase involved in cell wall biosynthesis